MTTHLHVVSVVKLDEPHISDVCEIKRGNAHPEPGHRFAHSRPAGGGGVENTHATRAATGTTPVSSKQPRMACFVTQKK